MRLVPLVPGLVMVLGFSVASCYPSHLMTPVGTSLTEFLENMKDNIVKSRDLKERQIRESWSKRDAMFEKYWNEMNTREKQGLIRRAIEDSRTLRRRVNPPRRFGKRSMIVGGSWG